MCTELPILVERCNQLIGAGHFDRLELALEAFATHAGQCDDCRLHSMFYRAVWLSQACDADAAAHALLAALSASPQVALDLRARAITFHATSLDQKDRYSEALRIHQRAVDLCEHAGSWFGLARALFSQAVILNNRLNNAAGALRLLDRAEAALRQADDQRDIVRILNERGVALMHERRWDAARAVLLETHARCVAAGNQYLRAICEINLGNWERLHEQSDAAEVWYLGALRLLRGQWELAAEVVFYLSLLAQRRGQPEQARRWLARVLRIGRRHGSQHFIALAHLALARLLEGQGLPQRALGRYWQAVHAIEQIRSAQDVSDVRLDFQAQWRAMYAEAAGCALQLGRLAEGLLLTEYARARVLLDTIGAPQQAAYQAAPPALLQQLAEWRQQLYALYVRRIAGDLGADDQAAMLALERRIAELRDELSRHAQDLHSAQTPPALAEIQAQLSDRAAILSFAQTSAGLGVFVIDRQQLRHRPLDLTIDALQSRLNQDGQVRSLLPDPRTGRLARNQPALTMLHSGLLAPIAGWLADYATIYLVPDLGLRQLPFHLLARAPDQASPLIEAGRRLCYLPSASLIVRIAALQIDGSMVAIGNNLPGLQLVEAHARLVARRSGGAALCGAAAHYAAVVATTATQIYFVGHNQFQAHAPADSGLLLGDGSLLTFPDIQGLQLAGRRVVLGSCQSGLVAEQGGDWVGLTSALLRAGVAQILGSLWEVSELATCLLMDRVWAALAQGLALQDALPRAQAELRALTVDDMRRSFSAYELPPATHAYLETQIAALASALDDRHPLDHPHYWGAFVIVGA